MSVKLLLLLLLLLKRGDNAGRYISSIILTRVRWMRTKARHATISFEVVEWSERLTSVISVWLGAAAVGFESDYAPAGVE